MEYNFPIPCGVTHDTTITIVGKPIDNFYIQLMMGTDMNLEAYKMEVKLHGDGASYIRQSQPMVPTNKFEEPYVEQCPASDMKPSLLPDGKFMPRPPIKYGTPFSLSWGGLLIGSLNDVRGSNIRWVDELLIENSLKEWSTYLFLPSLRDFTDRSNAFQRLNYTKYDI